MRPAKRALPHESAAVTAAIRRLTTAIATGGELAPLLAELQTYDNQRQDLEAQYSIS